MADGSELTTVESVREEGSFLFTATNSFDMDEEIVLVPCEDGGRTDDGADGNGAGGAVDDAERAVTAWINRCTHEAQRFDTGRGVPMRDGEIVCPKHGSLFDACSGACDNGQAAGTTLPAIDVTVEDGTVYLVDEEYEFEHEGGVDESDGPSSTSHIGF
jgi:nitrite reductase/ring-hydroxylating ferredoxin subunit